MPFLASITPTIERPTMPTYSILDVHSSSSSKQAPHGHGVYLPYHELHIIQIQFILLPPHQILFQLHRYNFLNNNGPTEQVARSIFRLALLANTTSPCIQGVYTTILLFFVKQQIEFNKTVVTNTMFVIRHSYYAASLTGLLHKITHSK